jgi:hypothetical protein
MRQAYRLVVYLIVCMVCALFVVDLKSVKAGATRKADPLVSIRIMNIGDIGDIGGIGDTEDSNFFSPPSIFDRLHFKSNLARISPAPLIEYSPVYSDEVELNLYEAVVRRLGRPYRLGGIDDRGYDCSGFIWRVFQDAGVNFNRRSTSMLWQSMPRATQQEATQFGTLVFFKGLNHVGIMRDAYSFYHASASQGIARSYMDTYWKSRVIGYRRIFAPIRRALSTGKL